MVVWYIPQNDKHSRDYFLTSFVQHSTCIVADVAFYSIYSILSINDVNHAWPHGNECYDKK